MKIGIVTVTFNSGGVLSDFFSSLEQQTYRDYNLYVVDNASSDDTCVIVEEHLQGGVLFRNLDNIGFAAGTNQGIRKALGDGCEAILILNNDVAFGPDLIQQLVEGIREFDCDMATPMMYHFEPKDRIWAAGGILQPRLGFRAIHRGQDKTDRGQFTRPSRVTFAPFCCVLVRSSVFDRIGLLDERFFAYAEDVDFMYRCLKANLALWYIPQARIWHKVSSLTGTVSMFAIRYGARNRAYFIHKHLPGIHRSVFNVLYPTYYVLRHLVGLDSRQFCQMQLAAWSEGARMLTNPQLDYSGPARDPVPTRPLRNGQ
jgi:GT2 family glycosyltransferase